MDNYNIDDDESKQATILLDVIPISSTEQETLEADEWVKLNIFGVCWDVVSYSLFIIFSLHNFTPQKALDYALQIQNQSHVELIAQGFAILVMLAVQFFFIGRFGPPGIFMCQQLKLYDSKNIAGMLVYFVIFLVNILLSMHIFSFLNTHSNYGFFALLLAVIYVLFYSMFLLTHGATAMVLFPLKFLSDNKYPPHDSKTIFYLKFFTLLSVEVWIYIASVYQDKKYNHTYEVLYGDADGNLLARHVVQMTQMIIIPFTKAIALFSLPFADVRLSLNVFFNQPSN